MTIHNIPGLKQDARQALDACPAQKQIAFVYTAGLVGLSLLLTLADFILADRISGTGGLGNLGTHTLLSTIQAMLPILQMLLLVGWNTGYSVAVLKISRRQHADAHTLEEGFSLFWPMLRASLAEAMIYFSVIMFSFYLSMQIYMFTPWSNDLIALLEPAMPSILSTGTLVLDDAVLLPAMDAMLPMMVLFVLLCAVLSIPVSYRLRMYCFCLIDAPRGGALRAIATSRRIMRRNCFRLFRLDLSFWWYHGLLAIAGAVQMLPLLGLPLPLSFDAQYYLFYGIYLILVTAVYTLMRNRVETTYAAAYETLREKPEENAVVLGNIFDM